MGAISQKLTALTVKNAKPGKHFDGGGLYPEVTAKGSKRFAGFAGTDGFKAIHEQKSPDFEGFLTVRGEHAREMT